MAAPNILEIEAEPLAGELTEINNRAVASIEGIRENLRVLLVSGEPHAGERTWRNLLKSDAAVDLVHFTILRPPEKQDGTPINQLSLIAFPTRELFSEKIDEFDLIIFDRYQHRGVLPILYFDNIARYVRDGGAVLVAAGPDYADDGSLYDTPLSPVLPVAPTGQIIEKPYYAEVTDRRPAPSGDPRPRRRRLRPAALGPLVPPDRRRADRGQRRHERRRRQAAPRPQPRRARAASRCSCPTMSGCGRAASRAAARMSTSSAVSRHWLMQEPDLEEEALRASARAGELIDRAPDHGRARPTPVIVRSPSGDRRRR